MDLDSQALADLAAAFALRRDPYGQAMAETYRQAARRGAIDKEALLGFAHAHGLLHEPWAQAASTAYRDLAQRTAGSRAPISLFPDGFPAVEDNLADNRPVELAIVLAIAAPGAITGIRFFKGANNTGEHVASIWGTDGALLRQAPFVDETALGWQVLHLDEPFPVVAGDHLVIGCFCPHGRYAHDPGFFDDRVLVVGALVCSQSRVRHCNRPEFPTEASTDNYWVDVEYVPERP